MPEKSSSQPKLFDHNQDRYPNAVRVLRRILEEGELPDEGLELLEIRPTAAGEITYRWRLPRAEETDGWFLPAE